MDFVARLGMFVDTSQVRRGRRDNDELAASARRTESAVKSQGNAMAALGRTLGGLAIGYASLATAQRAITEARQFNSALAETRTLIEGTAAETEMLTRQSQRLAATYGGTATQQLRAFYQAISAGADGVAGATQTLDQANRLAIGGATDITTAVTGLSSVVNAYGKDVLSLSDASDALFVGMKAGQTTIRELSTSLGRVAPIAANAGVSFDELVASVAALTKGGISTAESVTGVRAILAAVIKPSKEASDLAAELGIQFNAAGLEAKGLAGFLEELVEKTGGSTDKISQLFGGVEAIVPALALAGKAGEDFADILGDMATKSGETETAFQKMAGNLDQRLNAIMGRATNAGINLGNMLLNVLVPAIEFGIGVFDVIAENADIFALSVAALAATQLPALVTSAYAAVTAISLMEAQFIAGAVAARGMAVAAGVARGAMALLGGPVGIAVAGVTALAGALVLTRDASAELKIDASAIQRDYASAVSDMRLLSMHTEETANSTGEIRDYLDSVKISQGELTDYMKAQSRLAAETRAESDAQAKTARQLLESYELQSVLSQAIAKHGADSSQAVAAQWEIEKSVLQAKLDQLPVAESVKEQILAAAQSAYDLDVAAANATRNLSSASSEANVLAEGLGVAAGQAMAVAGYLSSLPGALAGASSRVAGLKAGIADLAGGGSKISSEIARYRAELEASLPPLNSLQDGQREFIQQSIDQRVELKQQELELGKAYQDQITALGKIKKVGGGAGAALTNSLRDAERAALNFADSLNRPVVNAIDQSVDYLTTGFRDGFDGLFDILKNSLAQMASYAISNPIKIALGVGGVGASTLAGAAASTSGSGASSGLLGGLVGGGGILGSFSSGLGLGASSLLSGGVGGYLGTVGAQFGAAMTGSLTAIGGLVGVLGPAAAAIGVIANGLKREYQGSFLRGNFSSSGFSGGMQDFFNGGFLRGDKTVYSNTDPELQAMLDSTVGQVTQSIEDMAASLDLSAGKIGDVVQALDLRTNDKTAEQIQEYLLGQITDLGNSMAELVVDTETFGKVGETAMETLTRLSTSLAAVNTVMDTLGQSLFSVSVKSADMASELVDLFGGLDAFNTATTTYYQAFFTEQERFETTLRQLGDAFAGLGIAMPQSRAAFRTLVEGLDLTTASGRSLYAELLGLAGALDEVLPEVQMFTLSISNLVSQVGGEIGDLIDASRVNQRNAQQMAQLWYRTAETLRGFLRDLLGTDLSAASESQSLGAARARFARAAQAARGGDADAAAQIPALAGTLLELERANASTGIEFRRAASGIQAQVNFLAGISELQGANEDVLTGLYEKQIDVLTSLGNFLQLEGLTDEQVASLDKGVQKLIKNWDSTVGDFENALADLSTAIETAEAFSYDDLVGRLDILVALSDNAPKWVKRLVQSADTDLRTALDFVIRSNDLTPDLRWIAVNEISNHVANIEFALLGENLTQQMLDRLINADGTINREVLAKLDLDIGQANRDLLETAVLKAQKVTHKLSAVLSEDTPPEAVDLIRILNKLNGEGGNKIRFGDLKLAAGDAFSELYDKNTAALTPIPASMTKLGNKLDLLRDAIQEQLQAARDAAQVLRLNQKGEAIAAKPKSAQGTVDTFNALLAQSGVSLVGQKASVSVGKNGLINSSFDYYSGTVPALEAFKAALRDEFGTDVAGNVFSDVNQTVSSYQDRLAGLRAQIIGLNGVPMFAGGGTHMGGARIVGERGSELEVTGPSRIYSASQTRQILGNDPHLQRMMAEEMKRFRSEAVQLLFRMERWTEDTRDVLTSWDNEGLPEERTT